MVKLTPAEVTEKHARRLKAATEDVRKGIERVTEAPGKKAGQKEQKMKQNLVEAIDSGKWKRNVESVSLEEWKQKFTDKGVARIGPGIDAAHDKTEKMYEQLLPAVQAAQDKVNAMPDLTFEDSLARSREMQVQMHKFKLKK